MTKTTRIVCLCILGAVGMLCGIPTAYASLSRCSETLINHTNITHYNCDSNDHPIVNQAVGDGETPQWPIDDKPGLLLDKDKPIAPSQDLQITENITTLQEQEGCETAILANYAYLADGTKFKATNADGDGFVYTGSLRWRLKDGVLTPESVAITGGRAVCDTTDTWAANYYICDHLGSVRTVTDENGTVLANYDYLPYGTDMLRDAAAADVTDYRFTGKEVQRDFGANLYDSFARFQHNNGRFLSIDPKAESFYHISPYTYCAGDPVNLVDPDGEAFETWWDILCLIDSGRSFVTNLWKGNYRDAFFDAIGVAYDAAAVFVPFMPGGANVALKTWRTAKNAKVFDKIWDMKPFDRGMAIEKMLGGWCDNFPVIDKYDKITKTATSIKSIDLNAKSYASPSAIKRKLNEYTDALYNFEGYANKNHDARIILEKKLEIAIPSNSSEAALQAVDDAIKYAKDKGIEVIIHKM